MNEEEITELCKEEISDVFSQIIDKIGLKNALEISKIAGGSNLYIPKRETIERPLRIKKIQDEFNGYNYRELALKYNKSESTIRLICKDIVKTKRNMPMEGQISF